MLKYKIRLGCHHLVSFRDRPSKGQRSHRIGLSVLYYPRHPVRQLCSVLYAEQNGHWIISDPDGGSIPVGPHPRRGALSPARIPSLVRQEGQSRCCRSGSWKNQRSPSRLGLRPA